MQLQKNDIIKLKNEESEIKPSETIIKIKQKTKL